MTIRSDIENECLTALSNAAFDYFLLSYDMFVKGAMDYIDCALDEYDLVWCRTLSWEHVQS